MRALSATDVLGLWENGRCRHAVDRALLLLRASQTSQTYDQLADWPVGQRDSAILKLRIATFGAVLGAYLDCPARDTCLEFTYDGRAFPVVTEGAESSIEVGDWRFRLPTSRDLAQISGEPDAEIAARRLLHLCCLKSELDAVPEWTEPMLHAVEARMAELDPRGDIELALACDACGHTWQTAFDVCAFFWEEIEARAKRLLQEVHLLASVYGWTEREVLALSDSRRAAYLEMVGA